MSRLTKAVLSAFAALLLGGGAFAIAQTSSDNGTVTNGTTVETPGDVSGPCDEAEHANDPRCVGAQRPEDNDVNDDADDNGVDDVSGPCDEAEHANDPSCTGQQGQVGEHDDGQANDKDDDQVGNHDDGDNSGPGSANSGPGNAGGDDQEDHSESGDGGSDSSSSGHGGSDDD